MLSPVGQSLGDCHGVNTMKRKNFCNEIQKTKKTKESLFLKYKNKYP